MPLHFSDYTTNLAAFLNSQLQLTKLKKGLLSHFLISKHSHLHLSLFHFCKSLQTFLSNKHAHLQFL